MGLSKVILIAYIMDGLPLNMREIRFYYVTHLACHTTRSIPFPFMITKLCRKNKVPAFSQVDKLAKTMQVTNILRLQDDENLEKKKKSTHHPSHTVAAFVSPPVSSTTGIPHAPESHTASTSTGVAPNAPTTLGTPTPSSVPPTPSVADFWRMGTSLSILDMKFNNFVKTIPDLIKAVVVESNRDI